MTTPEVLAVIGPILRDRLRDSEIPAEEAQ